MDTPHRLGRDGLNTYYSPIGVARSGTGSELQMRGFALQAEHGDVRREGYAVAGTNDLPRKSSGAGGKSRNKPEAGGKFQNMLGEHFICCTEFALPIRR